MNERFLHQPNAFWMGETFDTHECPLCVTVFVPDNGVDGTCPCCGNTHTEFVGVMTRHEVTQRNAERGAQR
jgi:rubrerythrin